MTQERSFSGWVDGLVIGIFLVVLAMICVSYGVYEYYVIAPLMTTQNAFISGISIGFLTTGLFALSIITFAVTISVILDMRDEIRTIREEVIEVEEAK